MIKIQKKTWIAGLLVIFALIALFFLRIYLIDGRISVKLGNPRDSLISVTVIDVVRKNVSFMRPENYADPNTRIGWITDIHADRFKKRDIQGGVVFPRQYKEYLPKIFDAMRERGINTLIATGDNVNSGDDNYARDLSKIAQEKHMHVIWVKGNHDTDETMSVLDVESRYYYTDYEDMRIIALDNVAAARETGDYFGGIDNEQLNWLRDILKTDKQVIIAMHIPMFNKDVLIDRYVELEKILRESGNVKLVLSGHLHTPWQKMYNGISYYG